MLISRTFGIYLKDEHKTALMPLADMINHRDECNCQWGHSSDNDLDRFTIQATKDIKEGDELSV